MPEIKKNKVGRPSKKIILEEFEIKENKARSLSPPPTKSDNNKLDNKLSNLKKAREAKMNNMELKKKNKLDQVENLIITIKNDELNKLEQKYDKMKNRLIRII